MEIKEFLQKNTRHKYEVSLKDFTRTNFVDFINFKKLVFEEQNDLLEGRKVLVA